jgi:hypothetical protein
MKTPRQARFSMVDNPHGSFIGQPIDSIATTEGVDVLEETPKRRKEEVEVFFLISMYSFFIYLFLLFVTYLGVFQFSCLFEINSHVRAILKLSNYTFLTGSSIRFLIDVNL